MELQFRGREIEKEGEFSPLNQSRQVIGKIVKYFFIEEKYSNLIFFLK